jgi:hypothetical protein
MGNVPPDALWRDRTVEPEEFPEGRELVLTGRAVRSAESLSSSEPSSGFGIRLATDSPEYAALLARLRKKP